MSLSWLIFSQVSASGSSSKNSGMPSLTSILVGIFRIVLQVIKNVFFRIGVFKPANASDFLPDKDDKMMMWQKEINFETYPSSMWLCAIRPRPDQRARNIPPKKMRKTSIARFSFTARRARHPHQIWSSSLPPVSSLAATLRWSASTSWWSGSWWPGWSPSPPVGGAGNGSTPPWVCSRHWWRRRTWRHSQALRRTFSSFK